MTDLSEPIRVSLIGHCTPDAFALRSAIAGFFPGAQVDTINAQSEFESKLSDYQVHLVNRVLDGDFADGSGIDLIRTHAQSHKALMLISNFDDSLQEAIQVGGVRGFGKSSMRSDAAHEALRSALGIQTQAE
jgi:DNA-binding NarL/FixJ family response regulator